MYSEAKAIIGKKQRSLIFVRERERDLVFCGLDSVHILSVSRHDYKVVLILS